MKKHKLVRINTRMYEQNKYLASRVGELGRERDALRWELADLKAGCAHAIDRNVALSADAEEWKKERADRIANFAALEQAHEALHAQTVELVAQRDAALARVRKSDEMFSRIQALCGSEDV